MKRIKDFFARLCCCNSNNELSTAPEQYVTSQRECSAPAVLHAGAHLNRQEGLGFAEVTIHNAPSKTSQEVPKHTSADQPTADMILRGTLCSWRFCPVQPQKNFLWDTSRCPWKMRSQPSSTPRQGTADMLQTRYFHCMSQPRTVCTQSSDLCR